MSPVKSWISTALNIFCYLVPMILYETNAQQAFDGSECGQTGVTQPTRFVQIVGAANAKQNDLPWQVRIEIDNKLCGGSIIAAEWVITAAHCLYLQNIKTTPSEIKIYAGILIHTDGDINYGVDRMEIHPLYSIISPSKDYDVALLHVRRSFRWSSAIRPICLMKNCSEELPANTICVISGWGKADYDDAFEQENLQLAKIPVKDKTGCQQSFRDADDVSPFELTDRMICAGVDDGHIDTCLGDSGGPLACKRKQIGNRFVLQGITSFGYKCGKAGFYGVYTRPCSVMPWLTRIVNNPPRQTTMASTTTATTPTTTQQLIARRTSRKNQSTRPAEITSPTVKSATIQEFPWHVRLAFSNRICSGALLSSTWILTSASCLPESSVTIRASFGDLSRGGQNRTVPMADGYRVIHPDYDSETKANDIALLKLERSVILTAAVNVIRLSISCTGEFATNCNTSGIGSLAGNTNATLMKAPVKPITDYWCQSELQETELGYDPSKACIGEVSGNKAGPECQAIDLGSPLVCRKNGDQLATLYGIASYVVSYSSCSAAQPSNIVFTRSCIFTDWIYGIVNS